MPRSDAIGNLNLMEKTMNGTAFRPGEPGRDDPVPRHRAGFPESKERRPAGTQAALDENVDNPLDEDVGSRNRLREQSYPVRWLRGHYAVSGAFAAIIAAKLGMGSR
jgi:hypothetical protein